MRRINGTTGVPVLINSSLDPYSMHTTVIYAVYRSCFYLHLYSWYALEWLQLLRTKVKPLLRITSQQEKGGLVTHENTAAVFKQSLTRSDWSLLGSKANNTIHNNVSLFTGTFYAHMLREKHIDKKGLRLDNWLDVALQITISPVVSKGI